MVFFFRDEAQEDQLPQKSRRLFDVIVMASHHMVASQTSFNTSYLIGLKLPSHKRGSLLLIYKKAMMFVKLYFRTSDIYLISLVSLDPSGFHLRTK